MRADARVMPQTVRRLLRAPRRRACGAVAAIVALLAAAASGAGLAGSPTPQVFRSVDTGLCPFSLEVMVTRRLRAGRTGDTPVQALGPTKVTLRNTSTGRTAVIDASGASSLDPATQSLRFSGRQVWLGKENHVPFLVTDGKGSKLAPTFVALGRLAPSRCRPVRARRAVTAIDRTGHDARPVGAPRVRAELDRPSPACRR